MAGGLAWSRIGYAAPVSDHLSHVGVQLYTLRSLLSEDFPGTLQQIADIGYIHLEFAGYYGHEPTQIKQWLDDLGLAARSGHFGMPMVQRNLEGVLEGAMTLGMEYVIVPALPSAMRESVDDYKKAAASFNMVGEQCREAGLQFGYHNHGFEFEEMDGTVPYEILMDETDAELVAMELDLAWIENAGHDPLAWFDRYPGRFPLWHVKDITEGGEIADVGKGRVDFPTIFAQAEKAGLHYAIVEHDRPEDPIASITASRSHLDEILSEAEDSN